MPHLITCEGSFMADQILTISSVSFITGWARFMGTGFFGMKETKDELYELA